MKLRIFAYVRVTSATGKARRRCVSARKGKTLPELVERFTSNVHRLTDPTIRSIRLDVRTPPTGELREFLADGEDGEFAWRHSPQETAHAIELLRKHFPDLTLEAGEVFV